MAVTCCKQDKLCEQATSWKSSTRLLSIINVCSKRLSHWLSHATGWAFKKILSKHLFHSANDKWIWLKCSTQIVWLALGANPNVGFQLWSLFGVFFNHNYGAPFMCWWESQTSKPSKVVGWTKLCLHAVFFFQKIKPRGQTITKQTFMDAATLEKRSVLMEVCFLLSAFQLPSMCLTRKELLSAALFPATPCFTFISDITHSYIWVSTAWNWNNKVKSILLMQTSLVFAEKGGNVTRLSPSSRFFRQLRLVLTTRFQKSIKCLPHVYKVKLNSP